MSSVDVFEAKSNSNCDINDVFTIGFIFFAFPFLILYRWKWLCSVLCLFFYGSFRAVHTTLFSVDGRRVISGSDDHTVKIWDVATSKQICTLDGHRDYVRAQTSSDMSPHLWITGCYDHMFRMFDLRQQKCIFTLDHGYPIEAVLRLGSGGLVVTAGGPEVRVHELFSGGKLLQRLHNHSKAVTSACLDSSGKRLLTGGLDQQMKVHDLSTFEVEASMLFKDQILSLAMSPDGTKLGAGLASGVCTVKAYAKKPEKINEMKQSESVPLAQRRRSEEVSLFMKLSRGEELKKQGPRPGSRAYLNRGRYEGPEEGDTVVGSKGRRKRKDYDVYLRKFMYGAALDKAMACGNSPTLIAVLEDLIHRNGLTIALKHRGAERLVPVLKLINSCLTNPKYTELMLLVANETLDMYGGIVGRSQEVDQILKKIHITLKEEVRLQNNLMMLLGLMDIAVGGKAEQQRSVELEDVD